MSKIYILDVGMELEGIFRKSGSAAVMNQLQARFEAAEDPLTVTFPPNVNGHSIAGLLKRYLQQLPEPVIPKQNQRQFIEAFGKKGCKGFLTVMGLTLLLL